jgi:hypothetical protein
MLLTWVPLLILASIQRELLYGVTIPLLRDYATDIRYLIALPSLIFAEAVLDPKLRHAAKHFIASGLVDRETVSAYEDGIVRVNELRDSWWASTLLVLLAFLPSLLLRGKEMLGASVSSWHVVQTPTGPALSFAGWWFALVSVPIYRLLLYRWGWIIVLWCVFLYRVTKLPLHCLATHPDRAAGLGFVVETQRHFGFIAFSSSAVIVGGFANQVVYQGKSLADLRVVMIATVLLLIAISVFPLLLLAPKLHAAKTRASFAYGTLGTAYTRDFDSKWIDAHENSAEPLLGTSDIQSLADLSNSFSVIRQTKYILIDREVLIGLGFPILLPIIAFLLAFSPTDEVIRAILKLLG